MLFNSIDFAIFLPLVFLLYWFGARHSLKAQNLIILISSYVFYGWWDWRFLSLIALSTIVDFLVGLGLANNKIERNRKILLWLSISLNLGLLGFFKYYNFFIENFIQTFLFFGTEIKSNTLNIILPVGISFYTFQTLSYTIDVYKNKIQPTRNLIAFAAFVSFFPQLVAGPIERAKNLLPQFYEKRAFNYTSATDGLRQILWGLFKKVVIADNCAEFANVIFNNSAEHSGGTLLLGAFFFAFQIYGDFSGYSDIAIGTSRLFGVTLMKNFAFPYFSRDIAEFWRRWHISLSTWFRDYLYIPLGGSRGSFGTKLRNTFIVFGISGFWHGANWTFIFWGVLNALYFLPLLLSNRNRKNMDTIAEGKMLPSAKEFISMMITFSLIVFAWIFFRAENIYQAFAIVVEICSPSILTISDFGNVHHSILTLLLVSFLITVEWIGRQREFGIEVLFKDKPKILRWSFYAFMIFIIGMFMQTEETPFIYFQF